MKTHTLILFLTLSTFISNAQLITTKKNGGEKQADYLFASAGISIPVGYIATQDYGITASNGPIVTLGYHHFYNKRWGMGLVASSSIYKGKPHNTYSYDYSTSDTWQRAQLYINASYTFLLKHRLAIDLVQGMGVYYMRTPSYIVTSKVYLPNLTERNHSSQRSWNTSYNIGIKSRFLVKENIGLIFSVNYFNAFDAFMNGASGFNSIDCELGAVIKFKNKK